MKFNDSFTNVELHTHLDGSIKPKTIIEVAERRNIELKYKTEESLNEFLLLKNTKSLREFLQPFIYIIPIFSGDKDAIWRMSMDFIEECAKAKTCYVEARFSPHILSGPNLSPSDVIKTVLEAFEVGYSKFGVVSRVIISGLREKVEDTHDLIHLAKEFANLGVVGIDVAGDEETSIESGGTHDNLIQIFKEAEKLGIHRTVHAGENGPAASVYEAVFEMHAERLGHGYRCLDDPVLYKQLLEKNIHFEVCPSSSLLTGAVDKSDLAKHPIKTFLRDKANFSINSDDTMITGRNLLEEFEFCRSTFHLTDADIRYSNLCAAKSSFLCDKDKQALLAHLAKFGIK